MGVFFGTDGLRGKVNEELTFNVAYKIGNALSILKENPTILVGSDTRISNSYLTLGLSGGALSGGANVIDVGIIPTAGLAYLTKELNADYGVVISASHNSAEYNGIKIFNDKGYKLGDVEEERIERCFIHDKINDFPNIGTYTQDFSLVKLYRDFLVNSATVNLSGKTIVLDCAHGAALRIAPEVFRKLGANVIASNSTNEGLKINDKCGATCPENLVKKVFRYKADMGFAFDGDADRLIAVDENGKIIDGDTIIFGLAKYFYGKGMLKGNTIVGTSHTNMAIENSLKEIGINMIRTDIGDKYVLSKLIERNLSLGGEQSGHIILKDYHTTGDGILSAIMVANTLVERNINFSTAFNINLYPQTNLNVVVTDKFRIINNEELSRIVSKYNQELLGKGRLMIRASGTEPKIRIMVESADKDLNNKIAKIIYDLIIKIDTNN